MSVKQDRVQVSVVVDGKQGISELGKLEMEANDLRHTMQGLKRDSAEYAAEAEKYKQVKAKMAEMREEIGLAGLTMKQLRQYARELQTELDTTATRGTKRYGELKDKLQEVNGTIAKQRSEVAGTSSIWSKISTEVKQFGMLAVGALGFQFLADQVQNLIGKGAKLSDELADVQKTTGMTKREVREFNSELSKIDTRTPAAELRAIAAGAGQLGIAKKDILSFTDATDKLVVALGDEFQGGAEQVTKEMGALSNIFSDVKSENVAEDMLHIGNALNELGASGAATGPVVADFANRIGGVGITMGLTSGQVLGLSATLQELNVSTERGGTATVKILQAMAGEPAKFAQVAGVAVKDFTRLINTDLYGALVKVAEGVSKNGSSATALAKILQELGVDGAGASEVMAKLGNNTTMLHEKVQLASRSLGSTSSIMNEFATKNDDLAGKLEKLTKALSGAFTNSAFNDGLESIVDGLSEMFVATDKVKELTAALEEQQGATTQLETVTVPLLARYDELKAKTVLTAEEQAELRRIIDELAKLIPEAVTQWDSYGRAMDINSVAAKRWVEMQRAMLLVKNATHIAETTAEIEKQKTVIHDLIVAIKNIPKVESDNGAVDYYAGGVEQLERGNHLLAEAQVRLLGLRGILASLKGEKTSEQQESDFLARHKDFWAKVNAADKTGGEVKLGILEELDAQLKALHDKQLKDRSEAEIKADEKEIKRLEKKRTDLLGTTKATHDREREQALKALHEMQEVVRKERGKLDDVDENADQQELNRVATHYDELILKAKRLSENVKLDRKERAAALAAVDELQNQKEQALANKKTEQAKKHAAEQLKLDNQLALDRANLRILLAKQHEKTDPKEYRAALIAKVELERDIQLQNTKLTEAQRQLIIQEAEDRIQGIRENSAQRQNQILLRALTQFQQVTNQLLSTFLNVMRAREEAATKAATKQKDNRLALLEREKEAGTLTTEEYEKRKAAITADYDRKAALIKKEQFEAEKMAAFAKAVIEGSLAVVKALSDGGPFAGPGLAVVVGAMAAAEIATIVAQEPPGFQEGGFSANGFTGLEYQNLSRHPGGLLPGRPFMATVNEVGPEYFVPHHLLHQPQVAQSVAVIEAIRTGGRPPAFAATSPAFAGGGYSADVAAGAGAPGPGPAGGLDQVTALRLSAAVERLNLNLESPLRAFVVYQDVTDAADLLGKLKQVNSF